MSLSGPLSGITFSGIASGVDTNSIIQKLIQVDQIPITNLQSHESTIQTSQTAIQSLITTVQSLQTAANTVANSATFSAVTGSSSDATVASVTAGAGSVAGSYNLSVTNLASAEKLSSAAQTDPTSALNQSGIFVLNGHAITVAGSDSLTSIAQNINSANAGVTASIINGGTGSAYLTLSSTSTGASNGIQLGDFSGTVLSNLGFVGGAIALNKNQAGNAVSSEFASSTTALASQIGLTSGTAGTFSLNRKNISVDLATDSLTTIAQKINSAGAGLTATVLTSTQGSNTVSQLSISGAGGPISDPNNLLGALGVVQKPPSNQLVKAQDASYSLDGVSLTSSSNTIASVVPGVTLNLLKSGTSTISLATDTTGIDSQVANFVTAYNATVDYIAGNTQYNPTTFVGGPLFGDFTTQQVQDQLSGALFNNVPGLTGSNNNLAALGFSLDSNNHLVLDQNAFNTALASNPTAVANVFGASGASTNASITYVSSSSSTVSTGSPYSLNITQAATQANSTITSAYIGSLSSAQNISFSGGQIGGSPYQITLAPNSTAAQIASQINSDSTLKNYYSASVSSGAVVVNSIGYGSTANFTITPSVGPAFTSVAGQDIQGTINGETASGTGQFLTGNTGNATTSGLQVQYTGSSTGAVGSITYSAGIATQLSNLVSQQTDPSSGILTADNNALTAQITDINTQITSLQTLLTDQQNSLTEQFANMESAIAALQQQGSQLSALTGGSSSSSALGQSGGSSGGSKLGG